MGYRVTRFEPTPNPNAVKCVLDRPMPDTPRSFFSPEQAARDPLAAALFALPGVTNVLIHSEWITVNKSPQAKWPAIRAGVERVLEAAP